MLPSHLSLLFPSSSKYLDQCPNKLSVTKTKTAKKQFLHLSLFKIQIIYLFLFSHFYNCTFVICFCIDDIAMLCSDILEYSFFTESSYLDSSYLVYFIQRGDLNYLLKNILVLSLRYELLVILTFFAWLLLFCTHTKVYVQVYFDWKSVLYSEIENVRQFHMCHF